MADKTEEQLAYERAAVDAMRNAKSNMTAALDRIETLERALRSASQSMNTLKGYIAPSAYAYPLDKPRLCTSIADDAIGAIAKMLA